MKCVILGAGKIARGFIGHLLYLNGIPFTFVEKFDGLVDQINERGQYTLNILVNSEKNFVVKGVKAISFADEEKVAEAIAMLIKNGESAIEDAKAIVKELTEKYPLQQFN